MEINKFIITILNGLRDDVYDYIWLIIGIAAFATLLICIIYTRKVRLDNKTNNSYLKLVKLKKEKDQNFELIEPQTHAVLRSALLIVSMFLSMVYIIWRIFVALPITMGWVAVFLSLILLIVEIVEFYDSFIVSANQINVCDFECPNIPDKDFPDVDVFVCTYNEPESVLRKTINGCVHMDYPDKNKVHIYVCDDKSRKDVKALAKEMNVGYITRKGNANAKAGNLNNALEHSSSEYIATFDADMIPKSNFLMKTMPYFVDANKINKKLKKDEQIHLGFVQSPQHFYQPDIFQDGLNLADSVVGEQEFFQKHIQKGKSKSNSVYCCGTNIIYSRQALEDIGGFYRDSITEDIATGVLIQNQGYVSLTTPTELAQGQHPGSFADLVKQRKRWSCGCVSTCYQLSKIKKTMSLRQKLSFNAVKSFWFYPFKSLVFLLMPIITAFFGLFVFECNFADLLIFWGITYLFKAISWKAVNSKKYSYMINKVSYLTTMFSLLIPLLKEVVGLQQTKFEVTTKGATKRGKSKGRFLRTLPFFLVFVLSLISFLYTVMVATTYSEWSLFVLAIWLLYNAFFMILCLNVALNDTNLSQSTVSAQSHKVTISSADNQLTCGLTNKLSENIILVNCDDKPSISVNDSLELNFVELDKDIKIPCKATELNDNNLRLEIKDSENLNTDYLALLYDDECILPKKNKTFTFVFVLWRSVIAKLFLPKRPLI